MVHSQSLLALHLAGKVTGNGDVGRSQLVSLSKSYRYFPAPAEAVRSIRANPRPNNSWAGRTSADGGPRRHRGRAARERHSTHSALAAGAKRTSSACRAAPHRPAPPSAEYHDRNVVGLICAAPCGAARAAALPEARGSGKRFMQYVQRRSHKVRHRGAARSRHRYTAPSSRRDHRRGLAVFAVAIDAQRHAG